MNRPLESLYDLEIFFESKSHSFFSVVSLFISLSFNKYLFALFLFYQQLALKLPTPQWGSIGLNSQISKIDLCHFSDCKWRPKLIDI
jgi:hypothetical protein